MKQGGAVQLSSWLHGMAIKKLYLGGGQELHYDQTYTPVYKGGGIVLHKPLTLVGQRITPGPKSRADRNAMQALKLKDKFRSQYEATARMAAIHGQSRRSRSFDNVRVNMVTDGKKGITTCASFTTAGKKGPVYFHCKSDFMPPVQVEEFNKKHIGRYRISTMGMGTHFMFAGLVMGGVVLAPFSMMAQAS